MREIMGQMPLALDGLSGIPDGGLQGPDGGQDLFGRSRELMSFAKILY
jgi:hypothetical protein